MIFAACGILIFWRRSHDWVAILVGLTLVGQGVNAFAPLKLLWLQPGWTIPVRLAVGAVIFLLPLACYLFPDGRLVPRWGRFVLLVWGSWLLMSALWGGFPLNIFEFFGSPSTRAIYLVSLLLVLLTGIYAQIYRYRTIASVVQRQQTKWIIFGIVAGIFAGVGVNLLTLAFNQTDPSPSASILFSLAAQTLSALAQLAVPVTVVLSILRYRLWDIDLVINRSLVYGTLSAILAAVYFGTIVLMHQLFGDMSGGQQSSLALAVSALAVAVLYNPTRSRVQAIFDRRFYPRHQEPVQWVYTSPGSSHVAGLAPGAHLGQYEVRELLGRGGMAEVYRGRHLHLKREVAIKVLPAHLANDENFRLRFEREARTVAALQHPNVVQLYDFGDSDGVYYMVMEYLTGSDLAQMIREKGRLPLDETCALVSDIAAALDHAHALGVVHRDVKPSNVMMADRDGEMHAVLTDFGIARIVTGSTGITRTGMLGTLEYVAPEQIEESRQVDGRADVYALGIMVFQMLTGDVPFKGENPAATVLAHLQKPVPDPRQFVPDLPDSAVAAILRALAKSPEHRFQTAGEFVEALRVPEMTPA